MKNSVFFKDGILTSTSANYLAELAKERVKILEEKISNLTFYSENIQLLGTPNKHVLSHGINIKDLDIEDIINKISQYKSFIAWVREALKAKSKLADDHCNISLDDWAKLNNIDLPEKPTRRKNMTESEYYDSISIKEKMEYLYLETVCSQIGKAIHEKGYLSNARLNLAKIIENPTTVSGSGRDACIISKIPTSSQKDVDELYFKLQTKHREHQARLNAIKHKCEMAIEKDAQDAINKFNSEYVIYQDIMEIHRNKYESWSIEEGASIRNLKIAIPNALESIYQELNSVTKD